MPTIQDRIKERRIYCGLTLLEVANELGVKEATVQRYESGEIKNIKHETIVGLANILNCSPAYLMGWTDVVAEVSPPSAENHQVTDIEMDIIKKYRSLDLRGQKAVLDTLNRECEFATGYSTASNSAALISDAICTVNDLMGVTAAINQHKPISKK
ncbi:MAG: helix-turn-helix transcriptional regulator [Angelakisella sp.]